MAGWRGAGGGGAGHWEEGVELQQPGQGQVMIIFSATSAGSVIIISGT